MFELRELERRDIPVINGWRRDRSLISLLGAPFRYIGEEIDDAWFDSYLAGRSSTVRCSIIDVDANNSVIGLVTLAGIDWVSRSAVLHIMIGEPTGRGKGAGSFAVQGMLRHAFSDLGLHRVELDVLSDNCRAIHVYEKAGFIREGRLRDAAYKEGRWVDYIHMAILDQDWNTNCPGNC